MPRKKLTPKKLELLQGKQKAKKSESLEKNQWYSLATVNRESVLLGNLLLGATNNTLPKDYKSCKAAILTPVEDIETLHLKFDEASVLSPLIIEDWFLKDLFQNKEFAFAFSLNGENLHADIYIKSFPIQKFNPRTGACFKKLFSLFYNITECETSDGTMQKHFSGPSEVAQVFKLISNKTGDYSTNNRESVQHFRLKPTLRPYQEDAVRWMIFKEKNERDNAKDELHPLFEQIVSKSGQTLYFDKYSGYVTNIMPTVTRFHRGGILADEMGLGKTVEVLACILNNPKHGMQAEQGEDGDQQNLIIEGVPIVEKQEKNRTVKRKKIADNMVDEPKKIKLVEDWVPSKKKSATYVALQTWYNDLLSEVTSKRRYERSDIFCVCGETHKEHIEKCVDCAMYQHSGCMGYKEQFGVYRCPQCWLKQPLIESKATLIVTPNALKAQWISEICKHVSGGLRVLQYEGSSVTPIYPSHLQDFDLVLTTYNVLQSDFRLTETGEVVELRRQRKYNYPGSPLTRINWWRLCLDEAQTVETPGRMVSVMAQKISTHIRWAVTGTPISNDISDLYGLIDYLQIQPYNEFSAWNHLLYLPYLKGQLEPVCSFLSDIMWRTAKNDVLDQINIPKQHFEEHWLEFSAVEKFFYKREHELASNVFLDKLRKIDPDSPMCSLDKSTIKQILQPLLSLRQACTHPNTAKGRYLATKKQVSSMRDLLEALILKVKNESEDYLRVVISSLNGLAGIYILLNNPIEAANEYRKVLQIASTYGKDSSENSVTIDSLQLIHTMYNLSELLETYPNVLPPTLRDSSLKQDYSELEEKYIEKFHNLSATAYQEAEVFLEATIKLQNSLNFDQWYLQAMDLITSYHLIDELVRRADNMHTSLNVACKIDLTKERSLRYCLATWNDVISALRLETIEKVKQLFTYTPENQWKIQVDKKLVEAANDCHLKPQSKKKKIKCPICLIDDQLKKYELKLFHMEARNVSNEKDMSLKGSWKPTSEEVILKALLAILKAKNMDSDLIEDGETHLSLLETIKKEFKEVRKLWTCIDRQVCALDEIDMCKIRLQLKDPTQEKKTPSKESRSLKDLSYILENKLETIHMLDEHELDYQRTIILNEKRNAMVNFEKSLGTQSYLSTLRKQQYEGKSPDPCPICKNVLEQHWSILHCGHSYCLECIQILLGQTNGLYLVCCICRHKQNIQEISYIKSGESDIETSSKVQGNFSTKIEAIVQLLIDLKEGDPEVKVIIFSTWDIILKFLKTALETNKVVTELVLSSNLEKRINNFKDATKNVTALLLPINLGAKGLNLIEATHVVLVEPLLNPGDELQAIGRVHRIGQTKPTTVHKFLIKNTIEESIHNATTSNSESWDKNKVTVKQLANLFNSVPIC